jgi:hypothetical protein
VASGPRVFALAILLSLALPWPCAAEWQFVPFIGYTWKGSATLYDPEGAVERTHGNFGAAVTLVGEGPAGLEAYFVRTPGIFQREAGNIVGTDVTVSGSYAFMGNAVLTTPRAWNRYGLRPYLSGGLGVLHAFANDPVLPIDVTLTAMNLGGGAVGLLTDRVGLRFDLRYFRNVRGVAEGDLDRAPTIGGDPVRIRYWTTSIGVVIKY